MSIVDNTITVKTEEGVTYGVSIADLRTAFSSSRVDLLAIICEDARRGAPIPGIDAADGITNGTDTLYSAFALSDIYANSQGQWERSNAIPIPSGWSFIQFRPASFPSGRSYSKGDLIQGRYPKWHLWADGINVGKVIEDDGYTHRLRYNIFKNPWSDGGPLPTSAVAPGLWPAGYTVPSGNKTSGHIPDLFSFQGYMTKTDHAPIAEVTTDTPSEWHNGIPAVCQESNIVRCVWGNTRGGAHEHSRAYGDIGSQIVGSARMALGNIVDWWLKTAYQGNELYGMMIDVKYLPRNHGEQTTPTSIASAIHKESTPLGYNTLNTAGKTEYRDGHIQDISAQLGILRTVVWNDMMYGGRPARGESRGIGVTAQLIGVRQNVDAPSERQGKVYLSDVMNPSAETLMAVIDPSYDYEDISRYRFILANETEEYTRHNTQMQAEATYDIPKLTYSGTTYYIWPLHNYIDLTTYDNDPNNSQHHCIRFQFVVLSSKNSQNPVDFRSTEDRAYDSWGSAYIRYSHFYALWDVACCDSDGMVFARFKGLKRPEHLLYENSSGQPLSPEKDTYFARITDANAVPYPYNSSNTGNPNSKICAYATGLKVSDFGNMITEIPESTTARLTILGKDATPHVLASPQYYDKTSDSFVERVERETGPSYRWYIQNYDPLFSHDNNSWKLGPLTSQAWQVNASGTPVSKVPTAGQSLSPQFTFELINETDNSGYIWSGAMSFNSPIQGTDRRTGSAASAYLELRPSKHAALSAKTGIASPTDDMIDIYITIPDGSSSGEWRLNIS